VGIHPFPASDQDVRQPEFGQMKGMLTVLLDLPSIRHNQQVPTRCGEHPPSPSIHGVL
jgi:hypothetical protein